MSSPGAFHCPITLLALPMEGTSASLRILKAYQPSSPKGGHAALVSRNSPPASAGLLDGAVFAPIPVPGQDGHGSWAAAAGLRDHDLFGLDLGRHPFAAVNEAIVEIVRQCLGVCAAEQGGKPHCADVGARREAGLYRSQGLFSPVMNASLNSSASA
jgi:hypothetical protein